MDHRGWVWASYVLLCLAGGCRACPAGYTSVGSGPCTPCPAGFFKPTPGPATPCTACPDASTTLAPSALGATHERECVACRANHVFEGLDVATGIAQCAQCAPCQVLNDTTAHQFRSCARAPLGRHGARCARDWGFVPIDRALQALSRNATWGTASEELALVFQMMVDVERGDEQKLAIVLANILTQQHAVLRNVEPLAATEQDAAHAADTLLLRRIGASTATAACEVSAHWDTLQSNEGVVGSKCFTEDTWNGRRTRREHGYCAAYATGLSLFAYALPVHLPAAGFTEKELYYRDGSTTPDACTLVRGPDDRTTTNVLHVPVQQNTTFAALRHYDLRRFTYTTYYDTLAARVEQLCTPAPPDGAPLLERLLDFEYLTGDTIYVSSGEKKPQMYAPAHDSFAHFCRTRGRREEPSTLEGPDQNSLKALSFDSIASVASNICEGANNTLMRVMMQEVACPERGDTVAGRLAALARQLDADIAPHAPPRADLRAAQRLDLRAARAACAGHADTAALRIAVTSRGHDLLPHQPWNATAPLLTHVPFAPAVATVRVSTTDGHCAYEANFSVPAVPHARSVPGDVGCAPDDTLVLQHASEFDAVYARYLRLEAAGRTVDTRFSHR